jgi:1,4-alpha-glucan branching enzyme
MSSVMNSPAPTPTIRPNAKSGGQKTPQKNQPVAPSKLDKGSDVLAVQPHHEAETTPRETTFHFDAPHAHEVLLVGEFTEWDKTPVKLIKGGGGVWHAKVALTPGRHQYRFLVDGQWQDDPQQPAREPNPFGTTNSLLEVH